MATEHQHHGAEHGGHHHGPKPLPANLSAPPVLAAWSMRSFIVGAVLVLISLAFLATPWGKQHVMRAYLMGFMMCFNFVGGALAFLMVQYVSGGKWGLILRRPLEAMTRNIWLVIGLFLPLAYVVLSGHMYLWAKFTTPAATLNAYKAGAIGLEEHLDIDFRHVMLNPSAAIVQGVFVLLFMALVILILNRWSVERDADPTAGTMASFDKWRTKFENLSGPSILLYVILLTDFVIVFVKSLDVLWASSVYGLQFLVAQGYGMLALGILTLVLLSRYEPMKSLFRTTEQHDMGKLAFAFTMLNIYLTFAEFLIIYSGNVPDEVEWYVHRIQGGWWTVCSLDAICHWVIPFSILLSRNIKRSKSKMIWVTVFMIGARFIDLFWLIEPNFHDAGGKLTSEPISVFVYATLPLGMFALLLGNYFRELGRRPLVNVNDPHTEEILEPEHAH